jgi:uncharacterized membrane protein YjgN (DUF898 family)
MDAGTLTEPQHAQPSGVLQSAPPQAADSIPLAFTYVKRPGLLKLTIVNTLLSLITFTIYRFWAKTNVRKHVWSSVHLNGEPLEYTGTGKELFLGALIVFGLVLLPFIIASTALQLIYGPEHWANSVLTFGFLFLAQVFWGFALYRARKFQLSRTQWRGIRGTMAGSAMIYSLTYFGSMIAKSMTAGWATPVMNTVLQEQMIGDMRFGNAAFKFKGRAGPLYPTYAVCWFLSLLALIAIPVVLFNLAGLDWNALSEFFDFTPGAEPPSELIGKIVVGLFGLFLAFSLVIPALWAIYTAKELRTFANYTRFAGAQFHLDATTGSVIWLTVVNLLIIILTLGIGWAFAQQRLVKFVIDRLTVDGKVDIAQIRQATDQKMGRGEGLADAFDVGGL